MLSTAETLTETIPITRHNTAVIIPASIHEDPTVVARAGASCDPPYAAFVQRNRRPEDPPLADWDFVWSGFGPGRTDTMRHAVAQLTGPEFGDRFQWFVLLDADDELIVGDGEAAGMAGGVYALELQHGDLRYYQPRLFHRDVFCDPANAWVGRTHEWWSGRPVDANLHPSVLAYRVNPDGVRRRTGAKLGDDFELLKADLADGSVDFRRCRFYMAQTLEEMGRTEEAFAGYLECLNDDKDWTQQRFVAGWRMLQMIADPNHPARSMLVVRLTELCPERPEPHWYMARQLGANFDPVMALKLGLEIRDDYRRRVKTPAAVYATGPLFLSDDAMAWAWGAGDGWR